MSSVPDGVSKEHVVSDWFHHHSFCLLLNRWNRFAHCEEQFSNILHSFNLQDVTNLWMSKDSSSTSPSASLSSPSSPSLPLQPTSTPTTTTTTKSTEVNHYEGHIWLAGVDGSTIQINREQIFTAGPPSTHEYAFYCLAPKLWMVMKKKKRKRRKKNGGSKHPKFSLYSIIIQFSTVMSNQLRWRKDSHKPAFFINEMPNVEYSFFFTLYITSS